MAEKLKSLDMQDEEELAEEVRLYPCLYDKSTKGYKEKYVVANAWTKVAELLSFVENGKKITNNTPTLCK